eukprot:Nk52_evm1s139 gene=Nk52_evmTU1s139
MIPEVILIEDEEEAAGGGGGGIKHKQKEPPPNSANSKPQQQSQSASTKRQKTDPPIITKEIKVNNSDVIIIPNKHRPTTKEGRTPTETKPPCESHPQKTSSLFFDLLSPTCTDHSQINTFLEKYKPSRGATTHNSNNNNDNGIAITAPWYWVRREAQEGDKEEEEEEEVNHNHETMEDVLKEIDSYPAPRMKQKHKEDFLARMKNCAQSKSGKWMCFESAERVDSVWEGVVRAVLDGRLGDTAKVASRERHEKFVICVYVRDFNNMGEVERVLRNLLDITSVSAGFKPDFMTYLGNYTSRGGGGEGEGEDCVRNLHKIPVTMYKDLLKRVKEEMGNDLKGDLNCFAKKKKSETNF